MEDAVYDYEKEIPAGFYDAVYRQKVGVRFSWHDLKFRTVAAELGTPRRLLDIGCGPGTFIGNYLPDVEALGLDISAAQIDYATRPMGLRRIASPPGRPPACRKRASVSMR